MSQTPILTLEVIYEPISEGLKTTEGILLEELSSSESEFAGEVARQLIQSKGKRLRPALVLFCSQVGQDRDGAPSLSRLAAAMEMIHVATLIHDDVIDEATLRRNRATINAVFGNKIAVLLGDYIYAKAVEILSNLGDSKLLQWISRATTQMCLGEFTQAYLKELPSLDETRYLSLIDKKTARLMAACCQCGAYLSRTESETIQTLYQFGWNFGMGFQIVDDCLDITGDEKTLGKPCGLDLLRGKVTLPIIDLYHQAPRHRPLLNRLYQSEIKLEEIEELKLRLVEVGSLERTMNRARDYMERAKEQLELLDGWEGKESLQTLADYALLRQR